MIWIKKSWVPVLPDVTVEIADVEDVVVGDAFSATKSIRKY